MTTNHPPKPADRPLARLHGPAGARVSRSRSRIPTALLLAALPIVGGACASAPDDIAPSPPATAQVQQPLYSDVDGVGPLNGVEWQIDAPWRLEPSAATTGHTKIPLTITFHDVRDQSAVEQTPFPFGALCGLYVVEDPASGHGKVTAIAPAQFHEIEGSRRWTKDGALTGGANAHVLRRMWNGDSPVGVHNIGDWTEWNATAFYEPKNQTPGADVKLIVMARVSRGSGTCSTHPLTENEILLQLSRGRESDRASAGVPPSSSGRHPLDPNAAQFFFGDFLKVHMAAAPLPRFDDRWAYGDLHYHSQGTDNEGESGINYRGVVQTMKAMGLDYAFATEHASNSTKISGIHQVFVTDIIGVPWYLQRLTDWLVTTLRDNGIGLPILDHDSLRDMSPQRFAYLWDWLNSANGVNAQVGASGGAARTPQIFLGGEVDVWPEVTAAEQSAGRFKYSGFRSYSFANACHELPLAALPILTNGAGGARDEEEGLLLPRASDVRSRGEQR